MNRHILSSFLVSFPLPRKTPNVSKTNLKLITAPSQITLLSLRPVRTDLPKKCDFGVCSSNHRLFIGGVVARILLRGATALLPRLLRSGAVIGIDEMRPTSCSAVGTAGLARHGGGIGQDEIRPTSLACGSCAVGTAGLC